MAKIKKDDKKGLLIIAVILTVFFLSLFAIKYFTSGDKLEPELTTDTSKNQQDESNVSHFFENASDEELLENDPFRDKCEDAGASEDNPVFVDGTYCFR